MLYLEGTRESRFNRPAKAPAMRKGLADPRVQRAYYTPSATEMIISGCAFGMRNVIPTRGDPNSLAHSPRTALARLEPVIIIASLPLPLDLRVRLQVGGIRVCPFSRTSPERDTPEFSIRGFVEAHTITAASRSSASPAVDSDGSKARVDAKTRSKAPPFVDYIRPFPILIGTHATCTRRVPSCLVDGTLKIGHLSGARGILADRSKAVGHRGEGRGGRGGTG
jgi:hypothetical protein